jgi:hypothetical protein
MTVASQLRSAGMASHVFSVALQRKGRAAVLCSVVVGCLVVCMSADGASRATEFRVSGAGSGTLTQGASSGCLNNLVKSNGLTAITGLDGSISNFTKNVANWVLDVNEKKTGTFKITGSLLGEPNIELSASPHGLDFAAVQADHFFAKSGTVTLTSDTGSVKAQFANTAGQTLQLVGSWTCKTP